MEINKNGVRKSALLFLAVSLSFSLAFPPFLFAEMQDVVDSKDNENIFLYVGDLVTVKVHSLTRIAVGNPRVIGFPSGVSSHWARAANYRWPDRPVSRCWRRPVVLALVPTGHR